MFPRERVQALIKLALEEDFGEQGDLTSLATLTDGMIIRGTVTAKQDGVIAGLPAVEMVYAAIDAGVAINTLVSDGDSVQPGDIVCEVSGNARSVLAGERTALNFLQRMSGIATMTRRFVEAIKGTGATILDTRKTHPGWRELDKYAVRMGDGENHRMGLYDMVLIKDNHIDAAGSISAAVTAVRDMGLQVPVIVEVKDLTELSEALTLNLDRILLDNMDHDQMRQAVELTAGKVPLEASGNIRLNNVRAVAETGVDFISVGALTHSAPVLDLSMRLTE
jgi:nicotinate-nucleotide pyrophosphorylase (carboxylating)